MSSVTKGFVLFSLLMLSSFSHVSSSSTQYHNAGLRIGIDRDSLFALFRSELKDILANQTPVDGGEAEGSLQVIALIWTFEYKLTNITIHSFDINLDTLVFELEEPYILRGKGFDFQCDVDFDYTTDSWLAESGHGTAEIRGVEIDIDITLEKDGPHFSSTLLKFDIEIDSIDLDLGDSFGQGFAEWIIDWFIGDISDSLEHKVEVAGHQIWDRIVEKNIKAINTTPYFKEIAYGIDISPAYSPVVKDNVLDVVLVGEIFAPQSDRSLFKPDDDILLADYNYGRKGIQIRASDHFLKSFNWTWFNDKDNSSHEFLFQIPTHYSDGSDLLQLKDLLPRAHQEADADKQDFMLVLKLVERAPDFHFSTVNSLVGTIVFEVEIVKGSSLQDAEPLFGVIITVETELEPIPIGTDHLGAIVHKAVILNSEARGDRVGSEILRPLAEKMVPFIRRYMQGRILNEGVDMNFLPELTVTAVDVAILDNNMLIQLDTVYNPDA